PAGGQRRAAAGAEPINRIVATRATGVARAATGPHAQVRGSRRARGGIARAMRSAMMANKLSFFFLACASAFAGCASDEPLPTATAEQAAGPPAILSALQVTYSNAASHL